MSLDAMTVRLHLRRIRGLGRYRPSTGPRGHLPPVPQRIQAPAGEGDEEEQVRCSTIGENEEVEGHQRQEEVDYGAETLIPLDTSACFYPGCLGADVRVTLQQPRCPFLNGSFHSALGQRGDPVFQGKSHGSLPRFTTARLLTVGTCWKRRFDRLPTAGTRIKARRCCHRTHPPP